MYDDATVVAAMASKLAEVRKDIVLVAHLYGRHVACEAAKGLAKRVREREGKQGGIARIMFVAAVVPGEGESLMDVMPGLQMDSFGIEACSLTGQHFKRAHYNPDHCS
jgi:hypothetical protein